MAKVGERDRRGPLLPRRTVVVALSASAALALLVFVGFARAIATGDQKEESEREGIAAMRAQLQEEARAVALTHPKPDPLSARPLPTPDPPPPTGIIEVASPFPASQYLIEQIGWQSVDGNRRTTVYTGVVGRDREQGVILVGAFPIPPPNPPPRFFADSDETAVIDFDVFPTPTRSGSLRIVDATDMVLTLLDDDGKELRFDVASRRYLR
jgi:hypothetical protein